jgi:hypothetical protein
MHVTLNIPILYALQRTDITKQLRIFGITFTIKASFIRALIKVITPLTMNVF